MQLPKVGVFELASQCLVMIRVERGVLLGRSLETLVHLLLDVGRQLRLVARQRLADRLPKGQLDRLDLRVELAQLRRQIKPLLD